MDERRPSLPWSRGPGYQPLRALGYGPGAAAFLRLEPSSTHIPPSSHNLQAKCSCFKAACRSPAPALRCSPRRVAFQEPCLILRVSSPLLDWRGSDAASDKSWDHCTVPGSCLWLRQEEPNWPAGMTKLGDGSKRRLVPGGFFFLGFWLFASKHALRIILPPQRNGGV